ncbi:MAG: TIGR02453 family protein [Acidobacteria bacterium]|nr:TIGR02453 family protein [Acidobacteriota bacterium]
MPDAHFSPGLFKFLRDLAANNDRDWFKANQERYEAKVREPALSFIDDFEAPLHRISPHFVASAKKVGGSLFRIHRDVRFSKDKSPYKTSVGIQFRHEAGKDAHAPGFYLHLQPKEIFAAVGSWRPDTDTVRGIREAIASDPKTWSRAVGGKRFTDFYELSGESLKRPPRGFDAEHPLIEEIKRKDFIAVTQLTQKEVCTPGFDKKLAQVFKRAVPMVRFLCEAVDADF